MSKQTFNVMLGVVVAIFIGAWFYAGSIKPQYTSPDEADAGSIAERIRPVGQVAVVGQESAALPAPVTGSSRAPASQGVIDKVQTAAGDVVAQGAGVIDKVQAAADDAVAQGAEVIDKVQDAGQAMVAEGTEMIDKVQESAGAAVAQVKDAVAAPSKLGQETYASACFACHTTGVAGSPKLGDADAWAPRIAQGMEVLNKHAIEGYQGSAGVMPAKGGRMDLSDEAVAAAVAYMVEKSGGS